MSSTQIMQRMLPCYMVYLKKQTLICSQSIGRQSIQRCSYSNSLSETGSLGCRVSEVNRITTSRSFITLPIAIENRKFEVKVKISKNGNGSIKSVKPEYDDIKNISTALKIPYKKVFDTVYHELIEKYK